MDTWAYILELPETDTDYSLKQLAEALQRLASSDFEKFIWVLYRLDIEEQQVREIIRLDPSAYESIASLILQREAEKKDNRERYTYRDLQDDEERW